MMDLVVIEPVAVQLTFDYEAEGYSEEASTKLRRRSANLYGIVERATDEAGYELYEAKQEIHRHKKDGWAKWAESSECPFSKRHADRLIEQWEQKYLGHHVPNQIEQPVEPVEEIQEVRIFRTTNEEKRKTVEDFTAETPNWQEMSNREIARRCGVDEKTVRNIRKELEPEPEPEVAPVIEVQPELEVSIPFDATSQLLQGSQWLQNLTFEQPQPEDKGVSTVLAPVEIDTIAEAEKDIVARNIDNIPIAVPHISSKNNEWYTPAKYLDAAHKLMRGIDLDPASCAFANETVKAARYYDITQNGLDEKWMGRVWLNPPYGYTDGESNQALWSERLIDQFNAGITKEAVLLVNAAVDTKWFQRLLNFPVCLTLGRINFTTPEPTISGSTHGSAFVYLGTQTDRFVEIFSEFGTVVRRW